MRGKYAAAKLYQANQLYVPTDALDIGVNPGDLVGVVQKKDPMGNTKRWFVDNGLTQGFLPATVLNSIGSEEQTSKVEAVPVTATASTESTATTDSNRQPPDVAVTSVATEQPQPEMASQADRAAVHSYDDVAPDDAASDMKPVRKAPPVPPAPPSAPPLPLDPNEDVNILDHIALFNFWTNFGLKRVLCTS